MIIEHVSINNKMALTVGLGLFAAYKAMSLRNDMPRNGYSVPNNSDTVPEPNNPGAVRRLRDNLRKKINDDNLTYDGKAPYVVPSGRNIYQDTSRAITTRKIQPYQENNNKYSPAKTNLITHNDKDYNNKAVAIYKPTANSRYYRRRSNFRRVYSIKRNPLKRKKRRNQKKVAIF